MWIFNLVPFTLNTIFWVNNYEECVGKAMFLRYRHQTWIENNNHFWKISYAEGTGTGAGASLPGRAALRPDVLASPSRWAAVSVPAKHAATGRPRSWRRRGAGAHDPGGLATHRPTSTAEGRPQEARATSAWGGK